MYNPLLVEFLLSVMLIWICLSTWNHNTTLQFLEDFLEGPLKVSLIEWCEINSQSYLMSPLITFHPFSHHVLNQRAAKALFLHVVASS